MNVGRTGTGGRAGSPRGRPKIWPHRKSGHAGRPARATAEHATSRHPDETAMHWRFAFGWWGLPRGATGPGARHHWPRGASSLAPGRVITGPGASSSSHVGVGLLQDPDLAGVVED